MRSLNTNNEGNRIIKDILSDKKKYKKFFITPIAEGLYNAVRQSGSIIPFKNLTKTEKSFWYSYAAEIPEKFFAMNLTVRPFENFCRTCIITEK